MKGYSKILLRFSFLILLSIVAVFVVKQDTASAQSFNCYNSCADVDNTCVANCFANANLPGNPPNYLSQCLVACGTEYATCASNCFNFSRRPYGGSQDNCQERANVIYENCVQGGGDPGTCLLEAEWAFFICMGG